MLVELHEGGMSRWMNCEMVEVLDGRVVSCLSGTKIESSGQSRLLYRHPSVNHLSESQSK